MFVRSYIKYFSPWGVFEVDVENMRGVERGLDWVLHHLAKKRFLYSFCPLSLTFYLLEETGAIIQARARREDGFC